MTNYDFFLEIGTEELPSHCLETLSASLVEKLTAQFGLNRLSPPSDQASYKTHVFATPRRIAVLIENLPEEQYSMSQEKGIPLSKSIDENGHYTPMAINFAKAHNQDINTLKRNTAENKLSFTISLPCQKTAEMLPAMVEKAIAELPIAKPMRWGNHTITFVRPVHWVVMMYNHQLVPATILGCQTTTTTYGHRVHNPEAISLNSSGSGKSSYKEKLNEAFVMADFTERRDNIRQQLHKKAEELDAVIADFNLEALLNEVTGLVEWPVALIVPFEKHFLELPEEVLMTSMQQHQKSFALKRHDKLIPYFLIVTNVHRADNCYSEIIAGNERVMKARLSDAAFFYEKDKQHPLIHQREATKQVIFQAGTLYDKSERLIQLAHYLAPLLKVKKEDAELAASLSQCDLMTHMVGEFPELQGTMGYYYALSSHYPQAIASAIAEQYWPRFSGDKLPETSLGTLLAIAERVDTLVGAFSMNQKPTGSKDPFKLRRHALGLIRLLTHLAPLDLNLSELLSYAFKNSAQQTMNLKTVEEVHAFILERLKTYYTDEKNFSVNIIQAVLARQSTYLNDFDCRINAIQEFSTWEVADALSAANKRVSRILSAETDHTTLTISHSLLTETSEKNLVNALELQEKAIQPLLENKQYTKALEKLASLREPIDAFFDNVMVNTDDPAQRQNRLAILKKLHLLFLEIADFACLN